MILKCPSCSTKYNFPDEKFQAGRKVKCTVCGNVFQLGAPEPKAAPAPPPREPAPALEDDGLDSLFEERPPEERAARPAPPKEKPPRIEPEPPREEIGDVTPRRGKGVREEFSVGEKKPGKGIDLDALVQADKGKGRSMKSRNTMAVVLMLLVLLGAAGYYFLPQLMEKKAEVADDEADKTEAVITTEQIKNFSLEEVKQYYVDNDKIGKLFVVQGKVVNNFSVPKELIKVEANLFDVNGSSVVSRSLLIGNTVSLFQLQMLGKDELESTINNKVGILTSNTNVPPGGEVPFVVVFYNPPDSVQEFGLKVVSAKDPPKK